MPEPTLMSTSSIQRPQRWDQPFGEMTDENVADVLSSAPFDQINPDDFPAHLRLEDILKNDARILGFNRGDVVVRKGDYGNSAFFVLWGTVRVAIESLPDSWLGRATDRRRGIFGALSQLWHNDPLPESRRHVAGVQDIPGAQRGTGKEARVFLENMDAIIKDYDTAVIHKGESFGEIAALARTPRTATVLGDSSCGLLEIRWQGLRDIRSRSAEIVIHRSTLSRIQLARAFARNRPVRPPE